MGAGELEPHVGDLLVVLDSDDLAETVDHCTTTPHAPANSVQVGTLLGKRFELTAQLEKSCTGIVYSAWDHKKQEEIEVRVPNPFPDEYRVLEL